jgi:hypothetical protein
MDIDKLRESTFKVEQWVESRDYKGYEPFDGLSSSLRPLTFGNLLAERILQQLVRQSPWNLRPLLGIRPQESTKGRGYMASGYLKRWKTERDDLYRKKAVACLEWLILNKSPKFSDFSWANHFGFASRTGRYEKHESIIVWTSLIGQVFLDAWEMFSEDKYLKVACSVCDWIMSLPREQTNTGLCISYFAIGQESIHNANMLGAAMLARTAKHSGNVRYRQVARDAMEYSCARQLANGAWYYAEASNMQWIDNFHTGYNLDSLKCYLDSTGERDYEANLRNGLNYYIERFIESSGRPKYYHNRAYPIDIQCAAQAIETLTSFSDHSDRALPTALSVADWTIKNMQSSGGHFYYRIYPWGVMKTPMLHWGQATMYKALASLLARLQTS